jgi:hypothetical protein
LGIELMPLSVSVIGDQPSSPTIIGVSARNTVQRTVPRGLPCVWRATGDPCVRRLQAPERTPLADAAERERELRKAQRELAKLRREARTVEERIAGLGGDAAGAH